jgi:hypothetical protein
LLRGLKKRGLSGVRLASLISTRGSSTLSPGSWPAHGRGVPCTSSETRSPTAAASSAAWSPPRSARCSTAKTTPTPATASGTSSSAGRVALKVCEVLGDAEEDLIAFYDLPAEHWTKVRHQPVGACQQGDRPSLRRRRDLPQRRARDSPRRRAAFSTKRLS